MNVNKKITILGLLSLAVTTLFSCNKQIKVTFNTNGGNEIKEQFINVNTKATRPEDPIRLDYSFVDWYDDPSLTRKFDFNTPINKNVTIYAKWEEQGNAYVECETSGCSLYYQDEKVDSEITVLLNKKTTFRLESDSEEPLPNIAHIYNASTMEEINFESTIIDLHKTDISFIASAKYIIIRVDINELNKFEASQFISEHYQFETKASCTINSEWNLKEANNHSDNISFAHDFLESYCHIVDAISLEGTSTREDEINAFTYVDFQERYSDSKIRCYKINEEPEGSFGLLIVEDNCLDNVATLLGVKAYGGTLKSMCFYDSIGIIKSCEYQFVDVRVSGPSRPTFSGNVTIRYEKK